MNATSHDLPIYKVLPELLNALSSRDEVVLQAPPGAGKTTMVPLALLKEPWLEQQKILVLEPRRLAARAAAERMAKLLNEPVGQTVGYKVRLDSKISQNTRIEVITEGILTRYLQSDPSLENIGLIIFDEFHERSLDADFGLALSLQSRKLFRNVEDGELPLKLMVMSATLDDQNVAQLMDSGHGPAPVVHSEGRQFPVKVHYESPYSPGDYIVPKVVATILRALDQEQGSLLVFLPGQGEIRAVERELKEHPAINGQSDVILAPLYGDLKLNEQRLAIAPAPQGQRKIVLATAIAESSLTIEGVSVVVDAGLSRIPMFDPRTGMTRLHTRRLSKAASIQRMGRAGRLEPGACYRLWSESQQDQLEPFTAPEIKQADLAPLALQLLCWGVNDPLDLDWLDPPPSGAYQQALDLLEKLGAIKQQDNEHYQLTEHGSAMAKFPAHPRIAHLLLIGIKYGLEDKACQLAALLGDRDPLSNVGADIELRLSLFEKANKHNARLKQQAQQFKTLCRTSAKEADAKIQNPEHAHWIGFLLACAYPDRIASRRHSESYEYVLSNGRAAQLRSPDSLQQSPWLVIAQLGGRKDIKSDQIFMATDLDTSLFEGPLADLIQTREHVDWDKQKECFVAEQQRCIGSLIVASEELSEIPAQAKLDVLFKLIRKKGLSLLPWTDDIKQKQARVELLREFDSKQKSNTEWPNVSDKELLATLDTWLGPYLNEIKHINHFSKLDVNAIFAALLPWPLPQKLDELAPTHIKVPSGSRIRIDYSQNPPVLAVRLQEMFGQANTPTINNRQIPLMVHLLSPARRPLAVTQDLSSFWQNAYVDVKKDMKGRYPKHYWPDNPLEAEATSRAKPRK